MVELKSSWIASTYLLTDTISQNAPRLSGVVEDYNVEEGMPLIDLHRHYIHTLVQRCRRRVHVVHFLYAKKNAILNDVF